MENRTEISQNLQIKMLNDSAVLLLGTYQKYENIHLNKGMHPKLITTLLIRQELETTYISTNG